MQLTIAANRHLSMASNFSLAEIRRHIGKNRKPYSHARWREYLNPKNRKFLEVLQHGADFDKWNSPIRSDHRLQEL